MQQMDLIQRLKEGIRVTALSPYRYYNRKVYYHIFLPETKNKIVLEIDRNCFDEFSPILQFKIVEVQKIVCGKKTVVESPVLNRHMALSNAKNLHSTNSNTITSLTGFLILQ